MPTDPEDPKLAISLDRREIEREIEKYVEQLRPSLSDKLNGKHQAEVYLDWWTQKLAVANEEEKPAVVANIARYRAVVERIGAELESTEADPAHRTETPCEDLPEALVPAATAETPAPAVDREAMKMERKGLRDAYKNECRRAGIKLTDEMIAEEANENWTTRDPVQKWIQCDPRYDGEPDRLIRRVFVQKPHLLKR